MKVGIISHYYRNRNCGGNLQAYALCSFINNNGYTAEQIDFDSRSFYLAEEQQIPRMNTARCLVKALFKKPISICHNLLYNIWDKNRRKIYFTQKKRIKKIDAFNRKIPHSRIVYNVNTIKKCLKDYSVFITGSDQVWNPIWYKSAYFLDFVPSTYPKISYAASVSQRKLTAYQQKVFLTHLKDFSSVSVRENESVKLLSNLYHDKIEWVLDPTLLLTREQWDEVASKQKILEKYVFCCFFSEEQYMRVLAKEFADLKHYKLVNMSHIFGRYRECDDSFGDYMINDVAPEEFVSLIKHAEYVFTDSFHACAFSEIYQKEYVVFERSGAKGMESRIESLTKIFGHETRFLNSEEKTSISYIKQLSKNDHSKKSILFEQMLKDSIEFLMGALKKAEGKIR